MAKAHYVCPFQKLYDCINYLQLILNIVMVQKVCIFLNQLIKESMLLATLKRAV